MCGIAGIIGKRSEGSLDEMLKATQHRGPDHRGKFEDKVAAIGMNRLSIIDTSVNGNQPFYSKDGRYIIVYNGEMYNFKEERGILESKGYVFQSNSDTEVVLNLFLEFGERFVERLRGMFAYAIWDTLTQKLFFGRDHFGIKPFYFFHKPGCFVFCSELKGMLASGLVPRKLAKSALASFLFIGSPIWGETAIENCHQLLPATCGIYEYKSDELKFSKYWSNQSLENKIPFKDYEEAKAATRDTFLKSVKEQLVSDVPLGVFLSGGMDSSLIVAGTRELGLKQVKTFSIGFEDGSKQIDERSLAEQSAAFYETDHYSEVVTSKDVVEGFDDFISALDQFSIDGLNTYWVSKIARKHVTVALSGLGADEYFCGYLGFQQILQSKENGLSLAAVQDWSNRLNYFPASIRKRVNARLKKKNDSAHYFHIMSKNSVELIKNLCGVNIDFNNLEAKFTANEPYCHSRLNKLKQRYIFQHMSSMILRDSDAVSMGHSLEVRVPFLDTRLAEISFSLPIQYQLELSKSAIANRTYGNDKLKMILGDAFKAQLPPDFFNRKKTGFQLPIDYWMRTGLKKRVKDCFQEGNPFLNQNYIKQVYEDWENGKTGWKAVWSLFVYMSWFNQNGINCD